jgi:hypothetical protein
MIVDDKNNFFSYIGCAAGAAFTVPHLVGDTLGQVDLLRHTKGLKPLLSGDTFEYLQKSEKPEIFKYITENKKLLYKPLFEKLGLATLAIAGGISIGKFLDNLGKKQN